MYRFVLDQLKFVGAVLLCLVISVNAKVFGEDVSKYIGFKAGYAYQSVDASKVLGPTPPITMPNPGGAATVFPAYSSNAIPVGIVMGIWHPLRNKLFIRTELEYLYRSTLSSNTLPILNTDPNAPGGEDPINALIHAQSIFANLYLDYCVLSKMNLYVSAGIGASMFSTRFKTEQTGMPNGIWLFESKTSNSSFAWQVGGGMQVEIMRHIKLDVGVRFVDMGVARASHMSEKIPGFGNRSYIDFKTNNIEILAGAIYFF